MLAPRIEHGFTLLETLIAIAAIAILVALMLPSLGGARTAASLAGSLANMRQHLHVFSLYNSDFDLHMPYFTHPNEDVWFEIEGQRVRAEYFMASTVWHLALGDVYYEGKKNSEVFAPPGYKQQLPAGILMTVTEYAYSITFITDPSYWTYGRREGPHQWRATRVSEVLHPSQKAVFFERWPYLSSDGGSLHRRFDSPAIGFSDGSVRRYKTNNILPGYARASGEQTPYYYTNVPTMHTIKGVLGRDVE